MIPAKCHKIAILGGGLAGLAASVFCGAPVYEASDSPGGVAGSDTTEGFTFDRGIHILQSKNQLVLDLLAELGVRFRPFSRNAFIYSHGTYTPYPFQVNTAGLPIGVRARCLSEFLSRHRNPEPTNYEEWMYRSLGRGFARTFLSPYSQKFWTIHPSAMTFEWTGSRIPQPTLWQVLRGAVWSRSTRIGSNFDFSYPESGNGYGTIAKALTARTGDVHCGWKAASIDVSARSVTFTNGASIEYELLVNTIPLPELVRICPQAPREVRKAADKLWTNSIFIVNLGIGRANISDRHWVHFPESDVSFFRISYPHTFGPHLVPPGTSSISAEVAYSHHRPIDKTAAVQRVIDDLIRVRALDRHDPIVVTTTRDIRYAYCVYDHNRKEALSTVQNWLQKNGIISCGRYGQWTYFWSDEAILSGKKAAEKVKERNAFSAAFA